MAKRLSLEPKGPQRGQPGIPSREKGKGIFSGRGWLIACIVIAVAVICIFVVVRSIRQPTTAGGGAIPPLEARVKASFARYAPGWVTWADRLREVYAALGPGPQRQMLETGEYAFHLGDIPKAQADVIREFAVGDVQGARQWIEHKYGKPVDLSKVTFKFGRFPEDPGHVRFMIVGPNGLDRMQPEIGLWPGSAAVR
jgi:hypothetical protein